MPFWMSIVVALAVVLGFAVAARRAITVLVIEVKDGHVVRAKGRSSGEMLSDLRDAVREGRGDGTIELVLEGGGVSVRVKGLDEGSAQRVRNVVGRFPAARLKTAPKLRA